MTKAHCLNIEKIITDYCNQERLIPSGKTLEITLKILPAQKVLVSFEKTRGSLDHAVLNSEIMERDAIDLFNDFCLNKKFSKNAVARIPIALRNIIGKRPTLRDVVFFGKSGTDKDLDKQWLCYERNFGKGCLDLIDEWLASMNLRRIGS